MSSATLQRVMSQVMKKQRVSSPVRITVGDLSFDAAARNPEAVVGDSVPDITFKMRERMPEMVAAGEENPFDWVDKSTKDLFAGKRIALFALPGAFTPTCSQEQLPSYESNYEAVCAAGVDDVYCLSVNDAFVMRQWGIKQGLAEADNGNFAKVKLIPDGAALFTRGMGMTCTWSSERGFGERSWRYSAIINDGTIEWLAVEGERVENSGPDPYEVSGAENMLAHLTSIR
jgi:peroxiredoxin